MTIQTDIANGSQFVIVDGVLTFTEVLEVWDVTPNPGTLVARLAAVAAFAGTPKYGDLKTIDYGFGDRIFYPKNITIGPSLCSDAKVTVQWVPIEVISDTEISLSTQLESGETDFDYDNLQLPYASRVPLLVAYESGTDAAPTIGHAAYRSLSVRVPILRPRSRWTLTRTENSDPSPTADFYVAKTNATTWKGLAAGVALMVDVSAASRNAGLSYRTSYSVAIDKETKWKQYARYIFDNGSFPILNATKLSNSNGMKEITVQGEAEFNDLSL